MNEIIKQILPIPFGMPERENEFLAAVQAALKDQQMIDSFRKSEKINLNINFPIKKAIEAETIREYAIRFGSWYSKNHWK